MHQTQRAQDFPLSTADEIQSVNAALKLCIGQYRQECFYRFLTSILVILPLPARLCFWFGAGPIFMKLGGRLIGQERTLQWIILWVS